MDTVGNRGAHTEIRAIETATPISVEWILDKAVQVHGAAGVSQDTPLAQLWAGNRTHAAPGRRAGRGAQALAGAAEAEEVPVAPNAVIPGYYRGLGTPV